MKNEHNPHQIAIKLRRYMADKDLQPKEVADRSGLKRKTFRTYIEGIAEPSIRSLKKICGVLEVSVDEFLKDV